MIPVYSLADNSRTGSRMIEVSRAAEGLPAMIEPAFLIPHRKDYYLFVLVRRGSSRHWVDSIPYTLKADTFYFTVPQQVHLKEEMRPMEGIALRFTEEFLQLEENRGLRESPLLQNPAGGHELQLSAADLQFVEDVLCTMLAEFRGSESWKNQMLTAQLRVLVIYLSRLYAVQFGVGANGDGRLFREFQTLVERHYREDHEVAAYAVRLHISAGHLNDRVKEQSGKTAIHHIHARILVEAKRQLLYTEQTVKEMADELGFVDPAYFNRWFKRLSGETPVQYRSTIREMYR
ncbi:AraC family transcriptional regulator [Puia sp.]|uniref:helix-turn-helix domain-containing protein n=1 Tax=Puia sp. TaxID=2045100 RepID=UPI002F3EE8CB